MKRAALLLSATLALPVHANQAEMAFALFNEDYPTLLRVAKPLAREGDCSALYYLGRYFEEINAGKDQSPAIEHYSRVVANAQCAARDLEGRTQARHASELAAGTLFLSASAAAAERIAALYFRGGMPPETDHSKAVHWWQVAENFGSHDAVHQLGLFHLSQGMLDLGVQYFRRHLGLISASYVSHPGLQRIESRESNYVLGKIFSDSGSKYHDRDKAISHLRDAAVLGGIEPSYLLALTYMQREADRPLTEVQGKRISEDDHKLAIVFLERAVEREVALPHLKQKRVQGQILLADLLFPISPDRARSFVDAATLLAGELDRPANEAATSALIKLKKKWGMD